MEVACFVAAPPEDLISIYSQTKLLTKVIKLNYNLSGIENINFNKSLFVD